MTVQGSSDHRYELCILASYTRPIYIYIVYTIASYILASYTSLIHSVPTQHIISIYTQSTSMRMRASYRARIRGLYIYTEYIVRYILASYTSPIHSVPMQHIISIYSININKDASLVSVSYTTYSH